MPLERQVAGVAMGLITDDVSGDYTILTDILGSEDAMGDMDFKVAGDREGITAFQMDVKVTLLPQLLMLTRSAYAPPLCHFCLLCSSACSGLLRPMRWLQVAGIPLSVIPEALKAATAARGVVLDRMATCSPPPRGSLAPQAPHIIRMTIPADNIGMVIGGGGRTIKQLQADTGSEIRVRSLVQSTFACLTPLLFSLCLMTTTLHDGAVTLQFLDNDEGVLEIVGSTSESAQAAKDAVTDLISDPEEGTVFRQVGHQMIDG